VVPVDIHYSAAERDNSYKEGIGFSKDVMLGTVHQAPAFRRNVSRVAGIEKYHRDSILDQFRKLYA
jgi:hypothetical protein